MFDQLEKSLEMSNGPTLKFPSDSHQTERRTISLMRASWAYISLRSSGRLPDLNGWRLGRVEGGGVRERRGFQTVPLVFCLMSSLKIHLRNTVRLTETVHVEGKFTKKKLCTFHQGAGWHRDEHVAF